MRERPRPLAAGPGLWYAALTERGGEWSFVGPPRLDAQAARNDARWWEKEAGSSAVVAELRRAEE